MLGTLIVAYSPQNEAPDDPVVGVFSVLLDALLDLFYCLTHLSFLEQGKGPVSVTIMVIRVIQFGAPTHVDGFLIKLVHVIEVSQVVVRIRVTGV